MELTTYLSRFRSAGTVGKVGNNQWLTFPAYHLRIYMRLGPLYPMGETLQLASLEVDEDHRGKGHFTRFLALCEAEALVAGVGAVYVENVGAARLRAFLVRRGYVECGAERPMCFLKRIEVNE